MFHNKILVCYNKNKGFSAIELLFVLPLVIGLLLITHKFINVISSNRKDNQVADQIRVYQKSAVMYINSNYRDLVIKIYNSNQNQIIPGGGNVGYLHEGINSVLSNGQSSCLYITKDPNEMPDMDSKINAYLLFGDAKNNAKHLTYKEAMSIANSVGGSTGVMVPENNGFAVQGANFNENLRFPYDLQLGTACGFIGGHGAIGVPDYSIIIDLTSDSNFFQQLIPVGEKSQNNLPPAENPSLQRLGNSDSVSMRTNIYLDNIINEQTTKHETYCSAPDTKENPIDSCNKFASDNGYELVQGSCQWNSSVMQQDGNCLSTAKGSYIQQVWGCENSDFGNAGNYCPAKLNNETLVAGTARWVGKTKAGNQCQAQAVAEYQSISCDFSCTPYSGGHNIYFCGDAINKICTSMGNNLWPTATGTTLKGQLQADGNCLIQKLWCRNTADNYGGPVTTEVPPNYSGGTNTQVCGTGTTGLTPDSTISLGYITGGSKETAPIPRTIIIPDDHRYRSLKFGAGGNNKTISVKSDAPNGTPQETSILAINHAGIQAGFIGVVSHNVNLGDSCQSTELGKIVQEGSTLNDLQSQFRCTYSPVSCNGNGYCYLPVKTESKNIHFNNAVNYAECPNSLVLDNNQPPEFLQSNFQCPNMSNIGYNYINNDKNPHRENTGCFQSGTSGVTFCSSVKSLCYYSNKNGQSVSQPISAILGIKCVAKNTIFVIDGYKE
jgi:hypothetical protein